VTTIGRPRFLVQALALCAVLLCGTVARADPMGSLTGTVAGLTGASIDISANHQIQHILLPTPFFAVYNADKTRASLTNIVLGMTVRVTFTVSPTGQETAREIDLLSG
jgi:hypothetical protein